MPRSGSIQIILMYDSCVRDSFGEPELRLLSVTGLVGTSPVTYHQWRMLLGRVTNHRHKMLVHMTWQPHLVDCCMQSEHVLFHFPQHELSLQRWPHPIEWQVWVWLVRRFFTWKHRSSQQREDYAEGSWAEPLLNITFCFSLSWAHWRLSFANNSKGIWLLAQCKQKSFTFFSWEMEGPSGL